MTASNTKLSPYFASAKAITVENASLSQKSADAIFDTLWTSVPRGTFSDRVAAAIDSHLASFGEDLKDDGSIHSRIMDAFRKAA